MREMYGVSLPPIRGAVSVPPGLNHSSSMLESRPDSRSSNGTSTSYSTALPQMFYDNCIFQTPRNIGTPRSFTKLPSLRGNSRGSRAHSEIHTKYSAKYRSTPDLRTRLSANSPFLPKATSEDCLKCLLKIPHKKCESHKYIRVGGGYRHGYWYVKCLLEELELQRQRELIAKQRLEAIKEKQMKAIKTYIRTKSGRLIERIVFMTEEDYELFKAGKGAEILKKYLTKEEAEGLESWDKEEVKAIKTLIRTKSGRLIEKIVYVSKEDYDAITQGKVDAKELLKKYYKPGEGETIEGWDEAKMKTIKTYVRTKSGRLIEKTIMISQEDYDRMIKEGIKPEDILKKYLPLEEGETIEGWESEEPMKAITMKVRTKSGRIIEKTIMVRADEYDRLMAGGADANEILGKYLGEDGGTIEGWKKAEGKPMKVIKTLVRTKSGRLVEKIVMLTEEEYAAFQAAGGDPEFLKRFMKLEAGEKIEDWEKASTVYEDEDDPELAMAKEGQRIVGKDGAVYEVVVDPLTGKKYKKRIGQESDIDSGIASMQKGKKGKRGKDGQPIEETAEERARRKAGKRDPDSDSDYSYKSFVSAGGTRHVQRRRKRADGTYSDPESYHSDQDPEGAARRRRRRREREHLNSAHSYYSVVSEGGTRHVRRRRKREDGTYSDSESYHSADSMEPGGRLAEKKKKEKEAKEKAAKEKAAKEAAAKKGKKKRGGSGSDYSYTSEYSEGGTRKVTRKKKIRDAQGNVIGYGDPESFSESDESAYTEVSDGKGGKMLVKKQKLTSKQKAEAKMKAKAEAKAKEAISKIKGGKFADVGDFSDSTISEDVDLENMTEEERAAYFKAKAERKAAREARRREKYGDKYDLMLEKQKELKKLKKLEELRAKGLISPSSDWSIDSDTGEPVRKSVKKEAKKQKILQELREKGLISPSSDWTVDSEGNPVRISELVKQGKRKKKDGHEADDESDESEYDPVTGKKIKKGKNDRRTTRPGDEGPEGYEYIYDKDGRVIGKRRIDPDGSGSEYEYEYDEDGNVRVKKKEKPPKTFGGDGEFDVGADGKIRLKDGKKKIDLSKLTDDDLRKLGIDPSLSKKEIARLLKEKFGGDITITDGDRVIPVRRASDFGSDADTDELANADDLDPSSLRGIKKVKVMWKRGGKTFEDHMKKIIEQCRLKDDYAKDLDEKDAEIDFLTHYKLVDPGKIESYAKAFVVEDEDFDTVISCQETKQALEGVPSVQQMTPKQFEYVFKVLKIDDASQVTFRMFAVISALCERVTQMDPLSKYLLEISDLLDIQRKMDLYRAMFYCNAESDRNANFIKAESLRIELIAGGLNWKQQEFVMDRLQPNAFLEISFLDYLCYVPLFLSMHENIVDNPLDMSDNKYDHNMRRPSGGHRQRDMNPLGSQLKKESVFQLRKQAEDLLEGKIDPNDLKPEKVKLLKKIGTICPVDIWDQHPDQPVHTAVMHRKAKKKGAPRRKSEAERQKKAAKEKLKNMTKAEKEAYRKGKRDPDSDSDYSYRSVVSAGGTRHVMRRRKRDDGTYSDEESYHSDQDADGEARRRQRRRDREHGSDSEHSYYSVVSEGGTRHVRRRKRHEDGTYSRSESYKSGDNGNGSDDGSDDELGSDVSVHSEYSEGGTRRMVQRQRIRDEDGNVIGYGDPEPISDNKLSKLGYPASSMGTKDALDKLQTKRNGELLRERTTDSLSNLRAEGDPLIPNDVVWPGEEVAGQEQKILKEEEDRIPSDFSDATTVDDIDLSKLTPAQRRQYFAEKERRRKEREKRRREKYGDKYDEIMKKRNAGKYGADKPEEKDTLKIPDEARRFSMSRRKSSAASTMSKGGRPKSMVTYDKGPPRDLGKSNKIDNREIGLAHDEWKGKRDTDVHRKGRRGSDASEGSDAPPKLHRETTMLKPLPTITQGKIYDGEDGKSTKTSKTDKSYKFITDDDESEETATKASKDEQDEKEKEEKEKEEQRQKGLREMFEVGKDGKLMLKKKKIDLSKLTDDDLRALGIDPNLSAKEIAKRLKSMFGKDVEVTLGDEIIGTKGIDEYSDDLNDDELAKDPNLDLDSLTGLRRVNIIMRRGGPALQKHMEKVISLSRLVDKYAKDLDERDSDIDFLNHYRLVEPSKIESYARAFVVEDADLDTVLNSHEARIALDGVPTIQHMTTKQMDYVMKVLKIDEATLVTFRMFAVITSLCERVTHMDSLSQRLLEICNLADIERKLDLYKSMFYHNVPSERLPNFITSESLKIELIAGGLNWKQQEFILEKLEPNSWGEVSFLDYMCYIPLFMSMHDNICYNPLDMSNQKYQMPPRARPASVQRDMNPLGCNLTKQSAYWTRKKAMEELQGSAYNASVQVSKKYTDILNKYSTSKYTRLKKIEDTRPNMFMREKTRSSSITSSSRTNDMIY